MSELLLGIKWYILRLKHRKECIERFRGLRWKEVHIKYENSKLFMSIVFEFCYELYISRGIIALDIKILT